MINSREKGARFEREIANRLKERGFNARRGQQYCGANGDADVVGLPGIHLELKAVERLNVCSAMDQSRRDARADEIPVVVHKRNRKPVLVTMDFDSFLDLYERGMR